MQSWVEVEYVFGCVKEVFEVQHEKDQDCGKN